jgi:predicted dehydrogenase
MGRWHADAVRRIGGSVAAIVDPNEQARRALAVRWPRAVLAGELDAPAVARLASVAHVCTPVSTHAPILAALVDAGVHALVEKPFTGDGDSTRAVLTRAEQRSVVVCPVHQFLFQDGVRKLVEWLPHLGPVRRLEFSTCSAGASDDPASQDALIAEILPHPLSLIGLLLDAPLTDIAWHVAHPSPGEFHALGSVGPTIVDIAISARGRPTENTLRVVGERGTASAELFHGFAVKYAPTVSRTAKITRPFSHAAQYLAVAAVNLATRAARSESAYPGLRQLVRAFYAATDGVAPTPISRAAIVDVADGRDALIRRMISPLA